MNKQHGALTTIEPATLDAVTGGFWGEKTLHKAWNATKAAVQSGVSYVKDHPEVLNQHLVDPVIRR
jgi:hypothetical protein